MEEIVAEVMNGSDGLRSMEQRGSDAGGYWMELFSGGMVQVFDQVAAAHFHWSYLIYLREWMVVNKLGPVRDNRCFERIEIWSCVAVDDQ